MGTIEDCDYEWLNYIIDFSWFALMTWLPFAFTDFDSNLLAKFIGGPEIPGLGVVASWIFYFCSGIIFGVVVRGVTASLA